MIDAKTIAIYDAKAADYAKMVRSDKANKHLQTFIGALPSGGHVLDIGCGPGNSAAVMHKAGLLVTALDPSSEMAAIGRKIYGVDIQKGSYDDIHGEAIYDGIWSNFSMLHVPKKDVPKHLKSIKRALKPDGKFVIGVKTGSGERRDKIGRKYTYFEPKELDYLLRDAGLAPTDVFEGAESGLDGTVAPFIIVYAHA